MGGPDEKLFSSRLWCTDQVQQGQWVMTESQIFSYPADQTQSVGILSLDHQVLKISKLLCQPK